MNVDDKSANRLAKFLAGCCIVLLAILAAMLAFLHRK